MKKLLALLLAGLLLIGFGVGGTAQEGVAKTPEELTQEELEALGRALLIQTMEDLRGDYTIRNSNEPIVHSNGAYAAVYKDGTKELFLGDDAFRVYSDIKVYHKISTSAPIWLLLLKPKEITETTPIHVSLREDKWLVVLFDDIQYEYFRQTGELYILRGFGDSLRIDYFYKEADTAVFSLAGMRESTALLVWLRRLPGAFWNFVGDTIFYLIVIAGYMIPLAPIMVPYWTIQWFVQYLSLLFR